MCTKYIALGSLLMCFAGGVRSNSEYKKCTDSDCRNKAACVTIYQHRNFGGWYQCLTFNNNECVRLNDWWINSGPRVSSVDTHGTCVRLHEHRNCTGYSLEMKPGSLHHGYLNQLNFEDEVQSVSSCRRPGNYNDCRVKVLFSKMINTPQVGDQTGRLISVTTGLANIAIGAISAASKKVLFLNVAWSAIRFFIDLFTPMRSMQALIDAKIEKAFAEQSAQEIYAKMRTITNRLRSALTQNTSQINRGSDINTAINTCEQVVNLFENSRYIFSRNRLVSSPYLVSFSATYLAVAKIQYRLRPELSNSLKMQMRELASLNQIFRNDAINKRKDQFTWDNYMRLGRTHRFIIQDKLVCPNRVSNGPMNECLSYRTCDYWYQCTRCQKNINSTIEQEMTNFFQPVITAIRRFPN